ncbi:MAG: sigma-70 family RNA polymerase sigma factor [Lentisphaeraceae bacterium]|nr:sigma-70 family RNA polymerase sigma factor [Lentisphaeraceae bacterium]
MNDEKELIEKATNGDLESFAKLIRENQGKVFAYIVVRVNNRHEAEDFTQEVFLTAFKKLASFDLNMPFTPWLRGIAANILRNYWRKKKETAAGGQDELQGLIDQHINTHSESHKHDTLDFLRQCLTEADTESSKLITLRYFKESSLASLKEELNLNHSTLTMRLHRIREEIRKCINQKISEECNP